MSFLRNKWLAAILRLIVGVWFIWFSFEKVLDPQSFADAIGNYRILPDAVINPLAIILPWIELLAGVCLVTGLFASGAAFLTAGMLSVFIIALISALVRHLNIECGCLGKGDSHKVAWNLVVRDALGLIAMIQVMWVSTVWEAPLSCFKRRKKD